MYEYKPADNLCAGAGEAGGNHYSRLAPGMEIPRPEPVRLEPKLVQAHGKSPRAWGT